MPRINLLPTAATQRVDNARNEVILGGLLLIILVVIIQAWQHHDEGGIDTAQGQLTSLKQEIEVLKKKVNAADDLKKKQHDLEERLKVIASLQDRRKGPAHLLASLAEVITQEPKVWLTAIEQKGDSLRLEGGAMEHENISDFQGALLKLTDLFRTATLGTVSTTKDSEAHYLNWGITCLPAVAPPAAPTTATAQGAR